MSQLPLLIKVPLAVFGSVFAVMGFFLITAPREFFISPSFREMFEAVGQTSSGFIFLAIGILVLFDALCTGRRYGAVAGIMASVFMIIMTIEPAFTGDNPITAYGIELQAPVAIVGLFIWMVFVALFTFYWWVIGALTESRTSDKLDS